MKNFILTLVIAIVSSVNVFGQYKVHFRHNTDNSILVRDISLDYTNDNAYFYKSVEYMPNTNEYKLINIAGTDISDDEWDVEYNGNVLTAIFIANPSLSHSRTITFAVTDNTDDSDNTEEPTTEEPEHEASVGSQPEVSNLLIYPNPVQDVLNIRFDSYENVDVIVTDLNGRIVFNETSSISVSVDLSNQPSGIYLVKVGSETRKVVKQ